MWFEAKEDAVTRPIGYWVKTVDRLIDERFADASEAAGLSRRQWQILNVLQGHHGASRDIVAAALAPFLRPGEKLDEQLAGIPQLVVDDGSLLRLTPEGAARLAEVRERSVQELRERVSAGLTREEYETTLRTLERIARNLGWSDPAQT